MEGKGLFQALHEHLHALARVKLKPHASRIAQHYEQGVPFAPWQPKLGEINLRLPSGRRLETHDWLWDRTWANLSHELLDLRIAALVAGSADLLEQPHRGQPRVFRQACRDNAAELINLV